MVASSYAYAGACERFGRGLPPIVSGHNAWYDWGLPAEQRNVVLLIGFEEVPAALDCGELQVGARFTRPFTADRERPVFICTRLRHSLREVWPALRRFM